MVISNSIGQYLILHLSAVLFSIVVISVQGCTKTENGIVFGTPEYEKRSIKVSKTDLEILYKTDQILNDESKWNNSISRTCNTSEKFSLYCALKVASIDIMGRYRHRQPALQEVRFIIDDNYSDRWSVHRLADFNANEKTSFSDIKSVLKAAIDTVIKKLKYND
jgi:hypothetical protein